MAITEISEVFKKMPEVFNAGAGENMSAVFQFEISGPGGGEWYANIENGTCLVSEGSHQDPSLTIKTSSETWLAIVNQEINAISAFMGGKLKVSGDIMLAQRIPELFPF
ncbi:SCP2 sterol-binding domain-containing protein [Thermodesulfobacteriota bacterium]